MTLQPNKPTVLSNFWHNYKSFVKQRTGSRNNSEGAIIEKWRQKLFTNFITYVLPSCLIALIPGVYMSLTNGFILIGVFDMLAVILIAVISLSRCFSLDFKRGFVFLVLYGLSGLLILYLSLLGPGLVYLLALSVVVTVTCNSNWAYSTVLLNFLICCACALIIHFGLLDTQLVKDYSLGVWIAVSSNLVFLSFVIVMLVSKSIRILERTIEKELQLKNEIHHTNLEQIQSNKLLEESEGHYKSLFFQNPSPMWVLDKETFRFLQVNQAAIENYGYTNEEFLSMSIMNIKMENEKETFLNNMRENEITGHPVTKITQHRRKNQEKFYVEVIFNSIPFMGKVASLAISNDITEQMNYIKAIQSQNEQLKEIAWIQCHEVRAPLASIMGLVQLYKQGVSAVESKEIMDGILESAEKLDEIIKETVLKSNPIDRTPAL